MPVQRPAAATCRAGDEARERPPGAQRERQQARPPHEREQRAHLQRRRLSAAVARDLEQLAVLHVGRAGGLAGPAAEAAIERPAGVLDVQLAGHEALHDVDAAARAVGLRRQQVERRAGGQAEPAGDALARQIRELRPPLVAEVDGGHEPAAARTAATRAALAGGAGRLGRNMSRAGAVTSASRRPAS